MNDMTTAVTVIPPKEALPALFGKSDAIDKLISDIEAKARAEAPDTSTRKGRDAIASLAHKVARSKTMLDEAGKALTDDWRKQTDAVNAERKKIRDRLDALKEEVRAPLTKWETDEASRVQERKDRLAKMSAVTTQPYAGADDCAAMIARIEAVAIDDWWQEFTADAARVKDTVLTDLRASHAAAVQREAEIAELARLRQEAAEREAREAEEREARQAEDRRIAAEKAEAERQAQIEADKQAAAVRAAQQAEERARVAAADAARLAEEREAALKREAADREAAARAQALEDARKAEADRLAAQRAAEEREAALSRQIEAEQAKAAAAAQAERDRIAAEKQVEADAKAKREADTAHRERIRGAIVQALTSMRGAATPEAIADALMDGKIPHVVAVL